MNNGISQLANEALNILRKSIILNEYEKLNDFSKITFRELFLDNINELEMEKLLDKLSESKLENIIDWIQLEKYYNSERRKDVRLYYQSIGTKWKRKFQENEM
jgi:hypothetical protein